MGTFHLISWFPFSFLDILKVSESFLSQTFSNNWVEQNNEKKMFEIFQMNIAGWILSIVGYLVGFYFAILFKQSDGDITAIAVESNIPNEGNLYFSSICTIVNDPLPFSIKTITN